MDDLALTTMLTGISDARLTRSRWQRLLPAGPTETVFLTLAWQTAWWECFGRGDLLWVAAERDGELDGVAPLFCDGGMIFFTGSGGSDYLDFVGDVGGAGTLAALLDRARAAVPGFLGFRFYHVPVGSPTGRLLGEVAGRLGLVLFDEGELPAPALDLAKDPGAARTAAEKDNLVRRERWFRRAGELTVEQMRDAAAIGPHLEDFFAQHLARWAGTPYPSLFTDEAQRRFYRRLTELAGAEGWLRFTRVLWEGRPIAFHYGFCYQGSYLWYKPTFDIEWAQRSPGAVLLRQLLLAALAEGAHTFDFGLGDEPFKRRFASRVATVRTWGLYPPESLPEARGAQPITS
ncbi:MAG: GNAT family N-acetyltransferase [Verrucomicrobia bacterium]|nr:GNAT family N-acetyltransferase [Verrucomicrobiota bacterium]